MAILLMALTTLVVVNERLNELLINPIIEYLGSKADDNFDWSNIIRYTSFISGIVLGYLFVTPLVEFVAEMGEGTAEPLTPMMTAFFALLVGGGSQLLHEIWAVLVGVKELASAKAERAEVELEVGYDIEIVDGVDGLK